jgi:rRNA-processing protein FCF1
MTQVKKVNKIEQEKIEALAKHLDCSIKEAINNMDDYSVLTNDEANRSVRGYIEESVCFFNPRFIANHSKVDQEVIKKLQELCEGSNKAIRTLIKDFDHFVDEAIATDGRGHFMSSYDGLEHEVNINGTDYYIYKI